MICLNVLITYIYYQWFILSNGLMNSNNIIVIKLSIFKFNNLS